MYHYVRQSAGMDEAGVRGLTVQQFEKQLDAFCQMMEPLDWLGFHHWLCGSRTAPERSFVLTFDDGLKDHWQHVIPALERRRLRGLFFVPGAVLDRPRMLSAHAVHLLLSRLGDATLLNELLAVLPDREDGRSWMDLVDRYAAETTWHYEPPARAHLKYLLTMALPVDIRRDAVERVFEKQWGSSRHWARQWYLNWEEVRTMQSMGHTIGAHGYAHEPYTRLSHEERRADMSRVAQLLADRLGNESRPLSFPFGRFNDDTLEACREAGFEFAFTTERACVRTRCHNLSLPRVDAAEVGDVLQEAVCP